MTFEGFNLNPAIGKAVAECGYTTPTPVQEQAIPLALAGRDIMASAQTGTGKTAAFVLPALERLASPPSDHRVRGPRVLVLTPTRELAGQVCEMARVYGKHMRVRVASVLGGMPYREQLKQLSQAEFVVATPGRLLDHMERGNVSLARVELLVLDEADRMLDMGFSHDVKKIASSAPSARQTLLFTATLDDQMARLAQGILRNPERVHVAGRKAAPERIEQRIHVIDDVHHKNRLLERLISDDGMTKAIIFSATKRGADKLAKKLSAQGHPSAALHGDMDQRERNLTISRMRSGRVRLLVATDVAARGLDVAGISHVINFDLPKFAEDYVHRIGRTGRAGAEGVAISFASRDDLKQLERIERYTGQKLPRHVLPGLEPVTSLPRSGEREGPRPRSFDGRRPGPGRPARKGFHGGYPANNRPGKA